VPEGKAPGCTETKADDGKKSTADAGTIEDSKPDAATKTAAATPQKPVKSKTARSRLRRSWFGKADLLSVLGR
jgi:hypothetical protein